MFLPEKLDNKILYFINRDIKNGFLDAVFVFFSDERSLIVLVPVLALAVYLVKKQGKEGVKKLIVAVILSAIAAGLSDQITSRLIKPLFNRPRPCQVLEGLYFFKQKSASWILTDGISSYKSSLSFVSSHASNSMAAAVTAGYFYRKLMPVFILVSILIGVSRAYVGVHYPTDIIAGWAVGAAVASGTLALYFFINKKFGSKKKRPFSVDL